MAGPDHDLPSVGPGDDGDDKDGDDEGDDAPGGPQISLLQICWKNVLGVLENGKTTTRKKKIA
jgi:hypothetical protein